MICKCGRGPRSTAWRGADPYSNPVLPLDVFMASTGTGLLLLFTFAIVNSLHRK